MQPTIDYIREHFELYNRMLFGGTLTVPPIRLTNARTYMGMLTYKRRAGLFGGKKYSDFVLRISQRFDYTEQELQDTIIHEMIHYYIAFNRMEDGSAHGRLFRQMMDDINRRYGRHITVSHRSTREERMKVIGNRPRPRVFAIMELSDGKCCIKVVPRIAQRVRTMHQRLTMDPRIRRITWYYSTDPYFALYPSSMGRRMQYVDMTELQPHLDGAKPITVH